MTNQLPTIVSQENPSSEILEIDPSEPIRQGDVFIWLGTKINPLNILCVVTADCDFAQNKTGNSCLAIPLIKTDDYLSTSWIHKQAQTNLEKHLKSLLQEVNDSNNKKTDVPKISKDALQTALKSGSISKALELALNKKPTSTQIEKAEYIRKVTRILERKKQLTVSEYIKIHSSIDKKTPEQILVALNKKIKEGAKDLLPDDAFFLTKLPHTEKTDSGLIAHLRYPKEIRLKILSTSVQEARRSGNSYARCGRLKDNYKYAISQAFGHLFSRIGLPKTYETIRQKIISDTTLHQLGEQE